MITESAKLQNEQAQAEFISVSSFAVAALVVTQIFQAYFAETQLKSWQVFFILGLIFSYLFSLALRRYLDLGAFLYPVFAYMILAPLVIGDQASSPWMSIGLITITANIYFGAFDSWKFGIASIAIATLLQGYVLSKNPASIADLADMKLLGGYFSLTWTLGIGVAGILIRRKYIRVLESVDNEIREETLRIVARLQRISKINRNDFRNLKLHSTTLNTLIHYRNTQQLLAKTSELKSDLEREISELKDLQVPVNSTLTQLLDRVITNRVGKRIEIAELKVLGNFTNTQVRENFIEIFRELLLNIEKHTSATSAVIEVSIEAEDNFVLKVTENSPTAVSESEIRDLTEKARSSKSLQRLIEVFDGQFEIRYLENTSRFEHTVVGGFREAHVNSEKAILGIRIRGIDDFAMGFARVTYLFGLIYIPGYYLLDIHTVALILVSIHAILANIISFRFRDSKTLLGFLTLISILLLPVLSFDVSECQDTVYFPWLYNLVLANTFIVAFTVRNMVLRWIPLAVLFLETVLLPRYFPSECQNIFVGSLPGIPIIATFAIALIIVKKRSAKEDLRNIRKVYEDREIVQLIDAELEAEYQKILRTLETFQQEISQGKKENELLNHMIELQIQRIRAFLFASEQFESEFIREVYKLISSQFDEGKLVRLLISGKNFFQFDEVLDTKSETTKWHALFAENLTEINLISADQLIVNFRVENISQDTIKKLTQYLNSDSTPISYSISSY